MVQHIVPTGMQRIRYYGLHGTAVYEKVRKKITGIVPAVEIFVMWKIFKVRPKGVKFIKSSRRV
jgi:hypothetical protein